MAATVPHSNGEVKYGTNYISNADVRGWTPRMPRIYDIDLIEGRHITETDMSQRAARLHDRLRHRRQTFSGSGSGRQGNPGGRANCLVIGVGEKRGSVLGQSRDNWVIIPLTRFQEFMAVDDSISYVGEGRVGRESGTQRWMRCGRFCAGGGTWPTRRRTIS